MMTFYTITKNARTMGYVETSTNGTIKHATSSHKWSQGKNISILSEWLHRHHMRLEPITSPTQKESARQALHPAQFQLEIRQLAECMTPQDNYMRYAPHLEDV